jgi:hypothetical protein
MSPAPASEFAHNVVCYRQKNPGSARGEFCHSKPARVGVLEASPKEKHVGEQRSLAAQNSLPARTIRHVNKMTNAAVVA